MFVGVIALPCASALLADYVAHRCGASENLATVAFVLTAITSVVAEVIAAGWMEERHSGNPSSWSFITTRILSRCRD